MPAYYGCSDLEIFDEESFTTFRESVDDTDMDSSSSDELFDLTVFRQSLPTLSSTLVEENLPAPSAELLEAGTLNTEDLFSTPMNSSVRRRIRPRSMRACPLWIFSVIGMIVGGFLSGEQLFIFRYVIP